MRRSFKAKEHIAELNKMKTEFISSWKVFTERQFRDGLKKCGIPSSSLFFKEIRNENILIKVGEDSYLFSEPDTPIHYTILQKVYLEYYKKVKRYEQNRKQKKLIKEAKHNKKIQDAIFFLRENGFEVFASVERLYQKVLHKEKYYYEILKN